MSVSLQLHGNLIVPNDQVALKYLQKCLVPVEYLENGLKAGDIVKVSLPGKFPFLCKLLRNRDNDCIVVSDIAPSVDQTPASSFQLEGIPHTPEIISILEVGVVVNEKLVQNLELYEDIEGFSRIIHSICDLIILSDDFDIDFTSYRAFDDWALVKLEGIRTNTEHNLGKVSTETKVVINNLRFEDTRTPDRIALGGLATIEASLEKHVLNQTRFPGATSNVLLIGASGSGKTALVGNLASKLNANFYKLDFQMSKILGENVILNRIEKLIRLSKISRNPTILLIEDIERFCPKASGGDKKPGANPTAYELLYGLDLISQSGNITVIATIRNVENLCPKVRRPGRLDNEVYIKVPNTDQRMEIIRVILEERNYTYEDGLVEFIAERSPAFVGGDLLMLIKTAARQSPVNGEITPSDIKQALHIVRPVSIHTNPYLVERDPSLTIKSLGGLRKLKRNLEMSIFKPLEHPERFLSFGLTLPKGILMYGPPGCAKTTVAKCLANEMNRHLIAISAAQVYSPYVGDSERLLAEVFHQARLCAPCVLFIDEIDAIVGCRSTENTKGNSVQMKLLSTLLIEMDGVGLKVQSNHNPENHILVIGATNRPDMIDDALLRPGRFDRLIYVPAPDVEERRDILEKITKSMPLGQDVDLDEISRVTQNYSGADLVQLCNETALATLSQDLSAVEMIMKDFLAALGAMKPSLSKSQIQWYEDYSANQNTSSE